jgi:hypothetical protein
VVAGKVRCARRRPIPNPAPRPAPRPRRAADAVSVASGGVAPKIALGAAGYESASGSFDEGPLGGGGGGGGGGARERLMVDDPLTGRDVSAGTYRRV